MCLVNVSSVWKFPTLPQLGRLAVVQNHTSVALMWLWEAPTESMSFPWYAWSCERHNWPIARWHLEYLVRLSTCNCQDLELYVAPDSAWLLFLETATSRHFYPKISEQYGFFLYPQGNWKNFSFMRTTRSTPFPSLLFLALAIVIVIAISTSRELLWRFKGTRLVWILLMLCSVHGFQGLLMYIMHVLREYFMQVLQILLWDDWSRTKQQRKHKNRSRQFL